MNKVYMNKVYMNKVYINKAKINTKTHSLTKKNNNKVYPKYIKKKKNT